MVPRNVVNLGAIETDECRPKVVACVCREIRGEITAFGSEHKPQCGAGVVNLCAF